jgi:hypothetical protein
LLEAVGEGSTSIGSDYGPPLPVAGMVDVLVPGIGWRAASMEMSDEAFKHYVRLGKVWQAKADHMAAATRGPSSRPTESPPTIISGGF